MLSENLLIKNGIDLIETDEKFAQVAGWNKYFISNYGRLLHKNKKNKYTIVNPSITTGGYLTYTLAKPTRTYKEVASWRSSRVEHDGNDYYIVGYRNVELSGLRVRVRK